MTEIAQATHNIDNFNVIMEVIYKRVRRTPSSTSTLFTKWLA
jgi:hypothetical protein